MCCIYFIIDSSWQHVKPGVHTNDFAPIYGRRANKLAHASLTTVFCPSRLTLPPILRENLESPVLRYQPVTTAVITDACLNTRWHHGAYTSAALRGSLGLDRVVTVYVVQSAQWTLGSWQFSRVVNRHSREYVRRALQLLWKIVNKDIILYHWKIKHMQTISSFANAHYDGAWSLLCNFSVLSSLLL